MKVRVWNDFKEFRENVEPLEFEDVVHLQESSVGGWGLQLSNSVLTLPKTVVIDIIQGEDE
jgi:hypothetical protein